MEKAILFWCLLAGIDAAVHLALQNEIPGHPEQCYDKNRTKFYDKGQIMDKEPGDNSCTQKRCLGKYESDRDKKVLTETVSCGAVEKKTPLQKLKICNATSDPRPYPECCKPYENLATPEFCPSFSSSSSSSAPSADSGPSDNKL